MAASAPVSFANDDVRFLRCEEAVDPKRTPAVRSTFSAWMFCGALVFFEMSVRPVATCFVVSAEASRANPRTSTATKKRDDARMRVARYSLRATHLLHSFLHSF